MLKPAFLQLCVKAAFLQLNTQVPIPLAFTKLLRSFASCAEAVEKLVIFRKGIVLNTLHRRHKYRDMIKQNATVMTVLRKVG